MAFRLTLLNGVLFTETLARFKQTTILTSSQARVNIVPGALTVGLVVGRWW